MTVALDDVSLCLVGATNSKHNIVQEILKPIDVQLEMRMKGACTQKQKL
eukprot:COSAG02_NODE_31446_length_533_cov_1.013825_2_plen_48_part_01